MNNETLMRELRRISIESNHRCFGCGYEHSCSIHGCAIIREALARLEDGTLHAHAVISRLDEPEEREDGDNVHGGN